MFGLFGSFFEDFFGDEQTSKNMAERSIKYLKEKFGGETSTEYKPMTKVVKKWTSKDGELSKEFVYYIEGDFDSGAMELSRLKEELEQCVSSQNFERCAEIRDEIAKLQKENKE